MNTSLNFHVVLSLITFLILGIAGLTAVLLAIQEYLVRVEPSSNIVRCLPPLITLEKILFQIIIIGFVLLSLLLTSSIYYFHEYFFNNWLLWQKTILVIFAWIIFAVLLMGRYFWGWRGRKAIYGTVIGVLILVVIYFSSKLVLAGTH